MFAAFRRLSKSAFGTIIMVLFLLAILASFALADISNVGSGTLGMRSGTLAKVGDEEVTDRELDSAMQRVLQQAQQQNPGATYASIAGQIDNILDQLINQATLLAFASDHGFVLSKRLLYQMDGMSFDAALLSGVDVNTIARMTEDCRQGIARFLKK